LQIGIHQGGRIDKPRAEVPHRGGGKLFLVRQVVGGEERALIPHKSHQQAAVLDEIGRVAFAIAPDVRPVGIFWIRPPVIALGGKVVRPARAARVDGAGDGPGFVFERGFGHVHDAVAVESLEVEVGDG
jgi:hypothetical protein